MATSAAERDLNFQKFVPGVLKDLGFTIRDFAVSLGRTDKTISNLKSSGSPDTPIGREVIRVFKALDVKWSNDFATHTVPPIEKRHQIHFDFSFDPNPDKCVRKVREAMSIIGVHLSRIRNQDGITASNGDSITSPFPV